jgi:hypothetical protein
VARRSRAELTGLAGFGLSAAGYVMLAGILAWGFATGPFTVPGGDVLVYDRVGDALRSGLDVYLPQPDPVTTFFYAPPWAVAFGAVSWLPTWLWGLAIVAAETAALRYVAGSWRRFGWFCLWPFVAWELPSGNVNLIIAAALVAAVRGEPRPAVLMALAKLSPALAIRPRDWRKALAALALAGAVTLPWLWLWPAYVGHLVASLGGPLPGPQVPIAFPVRLAAAGLLLMLRRPWAVALAAVIATPAFYFGSLVLLVAPAALLIDGLVDGSRRAAVEA